MTAELQMLTWSVILGFIYLSCAAVAVTKVRGLEWNVSARDARTPELTGVPARLDRAFRNFKETFPFFVAAVVISEFVMRTTGRQNSFATVGAHLYFWSRVLYLPLYAFGVPFIRTFVWIASVIGILLVLSTAFLAV